MQAADLRVEEVSDPGALGALADEWRDLERSRHRRRLLPVVGVDQHLGRALQGGAPSRGPPRARGRPARRRPAPPRGAGRGVCGAGGRWWGGQQPVATCRVALRERHGARGQGVARASEVDPYLRAAPAFPVRVRLEPGRGPPPGVARLRVGHGALETIALAADRGRLGRLPRNAFQPGAQGMAPQAAASRGRRLPEARGDDSTPRRWVEP